MVHRTTLILLLAAGGCFSPNNFTDEMPDDLPAGSCRDTDPEDCATSTGEETSIGGTSTGTTAGPVADGCDGSETCLGEDACVAAWDAQTESRGPFECRFACIPTLDERSWCSDDASCCEEGDVCTPRGYCVSSEADGSGPKGGSSSGDSTGG